ncbi:CsbD family protein [Lentilactobacillus parafarraginis]|uniref:CsbD family protein n=1 Tax=Lentilactobacillus parafarraginis TaxID=390842 RepID=UPI000ACDA230
MSKLKNESDKVAGKTKEGLGEATGNDKMALKGKLQNATGKPKKSLKRPRIRLLKRQTTLSTSTKRKTMMKNNGDFQ